jgi:hypothetical protein
MREPLFHFSFLIPRQSIGLPGCGISPSQGRYLYKHPCLEWDSNPRPSVRVGEDSSCLRPSGHCDRQLDSQPIGIQFLRRPRDFLFSSASRLALAPTNLPAQQVPGDSFPGDEASADIKHEWSCNLHSFIRIDDVVLTELLGFRTFSTVLILNN